MPRKGQRQWELIAQLETLDGAFIVFDPSYYAPNYSDPQHIYDITLQGQSGLASVFLERVQIQKNQWRNAAVKILFSNEPETYREKVGDVGIDSGTLAVASASPLPQHWMVGGKHNSSSIWIGFMDEQERATEGKRAAELLVRNGFKVKHEHDWLYKFVKPLSNREIEHADNLLRNSEIRGYVNTVVHHSAALIRQQLAKDDVAFLDANVAPYLIAFESGWGDGTYDRFALKNGEKTIGFMSQMIDLNTK